MALMNVGASGQQKRGQWNAAISWFFPALLVIISFLVEGEDDGAANEVINNGEHFCIFCKAKRVT